MATAALRAALVVAALVLGFFVLSRAFPTGGAAPVTPGGETAAPTTAPPPTESPQITATPPPRETHEPSQIELQVLNGTDVSGLAADTRERLEAEGYPVVTVGDAANKPVEATQIFFKRRNRADAEVLRDQFFRGAEMLDADPSADVPITIVLGEDYAAAQEDQ